MAVEWLTTFEGLTPKGHVEILEEDYFPSFSSSPLSSRTNRKFGGVKRTTPLCCHFCEIRVDVGLSSQRRAS